MISLEEMLACSDSRVHTCPPHHTKTELVCGPGGSPPLLSVARCPRSDWSQLLVLRVLDLEISDRQGVLSCAQRLVQV